MSSKKNKKTVRHYLKIYFISLLLCSLILLAGSFFQPQFNCANSKTCKSDLTVKIDNNAIGIFQGRKITPPKVDLAMGSLKSPVLGVHVSNSNKHIYVDLSKQMLYAYEDTQEIMRALISSGKWGRTPVGNFNIWSKIPVTRMAGGEGSDAYDLPNVQWVMFFHNDFGFHTAYWHNNFGYPMSHGCINMRLVDAKNLYDWADGPVSGRLGTAVSICSEFRESDLNCIQNNSIN